MKFKANSMNLKGSITGWKEEKKQGRAARSLRGTKWNKHKKQWLWRTATYSLNNSSVNECRCHNSNSSIIIWHQRRTRSPTRSVLSEHQHQTSGGKNLCLWKNSTRVQNDCYGLHFSMRYFSRKKNRMENSSWGKKELSLCISKRGPNVEPWSSK